MPQIYVCFLWHMHQPYYKDLVTGEYKLPWTRLHALKDYYGMARILDEFPAMRQTFNLVPSMMVQLQDYAAGSANDPFLQVALKPAEALTETEKEFLLRNSFHVYAPRMVYRYPRYAELYAAWQAQKSSPRAGRLFAVQDLRDLQVLSQLTWFDEEFQIADAAVRELVAKGRQFSVEDQKIIGEKQREIIGKVIPKYKQLAASRQIEISTTPYYHPILPLLCDSDIAAVSHPGIPLPPRFRFPEDARRQLEMARDYITEQFGSAPAGLWPSEGSVSDEALAIAADTGFRWAATDSGVLARTLGYAITAEAIYRPYEWIQGERRMRMIFRDHVLSDLIGFVYSRMNARDAAQDFIARIRENCRPTLASGRDALIPIILDGENAWEYYELNGRPFLRELYRRMAEDPQIKAVTASEAFQLVPPEPLRHIFPGSWINANFDIWIGAEEDNRAWSYLLRAREAYESEKSVPEARRRLAYEELLIAEGSDWCWWYGPEHDSAHRPDFDALFRSHLANVYRALGRTPPEELSRPILKTQAGEWHLIPTGAISPKIDGDITSYFEWLGAGTYRVDQRSSSMHGKRFLIHEVHYGTDKANFYLRVDFVGVAQEALSGIQLRVNIEGPAAESKNTVFLAIDSGEVMIKEARFSGTAGAGPAPVQCALQKVLELRFSLDAMGIQADSQMRFQICLWENGLPADSVPQQGWLELSPGKSFDWTV